MAESKPRLIPPGKPLSNVELLEWIGLKDVVLEAMADRHREGYALALSRLRQMEAGVLFTPRQIVAVLEGWDAACEGGGA